VEASGVFHFFIFCPQWGQMVLLSSIFITTFRDGIAKNPSAPRFAGLPFIPPRLSPVQAYSNARRSTPHHSGFARLVPPGRESFLLCRQFFNFCEDIFLIIGY
jgi:hypothetical protein